MPALAQRYRQLFTCSASKQPNLVIAALLILSSVAGSAFAAQQVDVDKLVETTFTPLVVGHRAKLYSTEVVVRNTSNLDILSPLRVVVTSIGKKKTSLKDADGEIDGRPYVEIPLPSGVLEPGQSTAPAAMVFVRKSRKDKDDRDDRDDNGKFKNHKDKNKHHKNKNKHPNFPVFDFATKVYGGLIATPGVLHSSPAVLAVNTGSVNVVFKTIVQGDISLASTLVLQRLDTGGSYPMNDDGADGDAVAGDGFHSASVTFNTNQLLAEQCLPFVATTIVGGVEELSSPRYDLCVTSFQPSIVISNTAPENLVVDQAGAEAVADEAVVIFAAGVSEAQVKNILATVQAEVVGTVLKYRLYQVRFAQPLTLSQLETVLNNLNNRQAVVNAFPNYVGRVAATPSDTHFNLQHGLSLINADDIWDIGATGAGRTITFLDSGVDASHPDLAGKVLPDPSVAPYAFAGMGNTDSVGHGTSVAGIAAANTDNASEGIAGVARDASIESIKVSDTTVVTYALMVNGFSEVADSGTGGIVNASISGGPWISSSVDTLCTAINDVVLNGVTPVAVVVNSAGNNGLTGNFYPSRCNDASSTDHDGLTDKRLLITVMNSISCDTTDTITCDPTKVDTLFSSSNYGAWMDVAAPGTYIYAPQNGGGYDYGNGPDGTNLAAVDDGNPNTNPAGTSFASPMVSGAAAILRSCNVPFDQIESALTAGSLNAITFTGGSAPRIDLHEAMNSVNTAPSGLSLSNAAIDELAEPLDTTASALLVGSLSIAAPDVCDTLVYSVSGIDAGSFQINGNNLEFRSGEELDADAKASYNITLRATDYFGEFTEISPSITLNNINEAPTLTGVTFNIPEDLASGTLVGTVGFSDEDGDLSSSFSIDSAGNPGPAFDIDAAGQITVSSPSVLDFDTLATQTYSLTVTATDDGTPTLGSNPVTVAVNLSGVNDNLPVFTSAAAVSLMENIAAVQTLTATDADLPTLPVTFDPVVTGVDGALFQVVGDGLSFKDLPDYEFPLDAGGDNIYNITVTANNGVEAPATQNIVVTVTNEVEPGEGTNLAPNASFESGSGGNPNGWIPNPNSTDGIFLWDTSFGRSGSSSLKITASSRAVGISNPGWSTAGFIPLDPTATYLASVYTYTPDTGVGHVPAIQFFEADGTFLGTLGAIGPSGDIDPPGVWVNKTYVFTASDFPGLVTATQVKLLVVQDINSTLGVFTTVFFDDVSFEQLP